MHKEGRSDVLIIKHRILTVPISAYLEICQTVSQGIHQTIPCTCYVWFPPFCIEFIRKWRQNERCYRIQNFATKQHSKYTKRCYRVQNFTPSKMHKKQNFTPSKMQSIQKDALDYKTLHQARCIRYKTLHQARCKVYKKMLQNTKLYAKQDA